MVPTFSPLATEFAGELPATPGGRKWQVPPGRLVERQPERIDVRGELPFQEESGQRCERLTMLQRSSGQRSRLLLTGLDAFENVRFGEAPRRPPLVCGLVCQPLEAFVCWR